MGSTHKAARKRAIKRGVGQVVGLTMSLALFAAATPHVASAQYAYGLANLPGADFHGFDATIRSNYLSVPDTSTQHALDSAWDEQSNLQYWIEAGMFTGQLQTISSNSPTLYWADSRPNGGYHEHKGAAANLDTYYDDNLQYSGSCSWLVTVGGWGGTSTSNCYNSQDLYTGTEVENTSSATVCSGQSGLGWYDTSGNLHEGWSDSGGNATISCSICAGDPPYVGWVTQYSHIRDWEGVSSC